MIKKNGKAFFLSVSFHFFILSILLFSFHWHGASFVTQIKDGSTKVINAHIIDMSKIITPTLKIPPKPLQDAKKITTFVKTTIPASQKDTKKTIASASTITKPQKEKIAQQLLLDLKHNIASKKKMQQKKLAKLFQKELQQAAVKNLQKQVMEEAKHFKSLEVADRKSVV